MNTSQSEVVSPPPIEMNTGPGQRLKNAREAISLSIEEVAAHLHLDTRTIGNLETDNYDDLPAPTFVRGYLRSYARLLNIAPDPIIDGFDQRGLQPPPLVADISTSEEAKASDPAMRIATLALALAMLIGVGLWSKSQFIDASPLDSFAANTTQTEEDITSLDRPVLPEDGPKPALLSDTIAATSDQNQDGNSFDSPLLTSRTTDLSNTTTEIVEPTTEETVLQTEGVGRVVLKVRASSWIEIYDRDGERLYYNTGKAGDTIDVKGSEPLQVLLGFADGVQVEYNGALYEPTATRGLARFTLGEG